MDDVINNQMGLILSDEEVQKFMKIESEEICWNAKVSVRPEYVTKTPEESCVSVANLKCMTGLLSLTSIAFQNLQLQQQWRQQQQHLPVVTQMRVNLSFLFHKIEKVEKAIFSQSFGPVIKQCQRSIRILLSVKETNPNA